MGVFRANHNARRSVYSHPVIADVVAGPPEADSIKAYTRIVWLYPITHERRIEKEIEVKVLKTLLLNVIVASPHRPLYTRDRRKFLETNGIVQSSSTSRQAIRCD
ncbi:hypothetical protein [Methanopyrus sp.]